MCRRLVMPAKMHFFRRQHLFLDFMKRIPALPCLSHYLPPSTKQHPARPKLIFHSNLRIETQQEQEKALAGYVDYYSRSTRGTFVYRSNHRQE